MWTLISEPTHAATETEAHAPWILEYEAGTPVVRIMAAS
jgi:hypothetical protein